MSAFPYFENIYLEVYQQRKLVWLKLGALKST